MSKDADDMADKTWGFDDFQIGHRFPSFRYGISAADSDDFIKTFDHDSVQTEGCALTDSAARRRTVRFVHPTLAGSFQPQHAAFKWPTGVLHAREKVRLTAPIYPGEALEACVTVKNKYVKNDRRFIVLEISVHKLENDRLAMIIERSLVWPL